MRRLLSQDRRFSVFDISLPITPNALRFGSSKISNLGNISIGSCYEALGSYHADALLGHHRSLLPNWTFYEKIRKVQMKKINECRYIGGFRGLGKNYLLKSCILSFS